MTRRTRIKFCGMTRVEDALLAASLGADAIGLIFTARSKRRVTLQQALAIRDALPPLVSTVALFMDDEPALVREVLDRLRPDLAQFHGGEDAAWCGQFDYPYIKALAMGEGAAALAALSGFPAARALLLDGHGLGQSGGNGQRFDWSLIPGQLAQPLILAGGLHADNVATAVRQARPWAVDVSSGVEIRPGIKDPDAMRRFVEAVGEADRDI